ncbi:MAG: hypothetical protein IPG32_13040 [Saprospirales bacterium]|nr:hypothetical protein [Saprospirales bacterium]
MEPRFPTQTTTYCLLSLEDLTTGCTQHGNRIDHGDGQQPVFAGTANV